MEFRRVLFRSARTAPVEEKDREEAADLYLLTDKPVLYLCNVDEASVKTGNKHVDAIKEAISSENAELLMISAAIEADIAELDTYEDKDRKSTRLNSSH